MWPPNNSSCGVSRAAIVWRPVLTVALLNNPGLQGTPATRQPPAAGRLAGRPRPSPRTASIQAPAAVTVLIGRTTVFQWCAAVLLRACLRFLHTVKHFRIVLYRIVSRYFVWYRIISYRVPYGCIVPSLLLFFELFLSLWYLPSCKGTTQSLHILSEGEPLIYIGVWN